MSTQFQTISPVDNSIYVEREYATGEQIQTALEEAQKAHIYWKNVPLTQRVQLCTQAIELLKTKQDQLAREICWQMGRPIVHAGGEINGVIERAEYMLSIAESALAPIQVPGNHTRIRYIQKEPLGVVLLIAPWNYPYLTAINTLIPALVAGNTVIIKHSTQTPLCAERLVEIFLEAGFPDSVFQYLHLTHAGCEQVIEHPAINFVAFTGSVAGGRSIASSSAQYFKGVGLELGGKDPAYIREDADLATAVASVMDGVFFNAGQSCCGIERIYVHKAVYHDFVEAACQWVKALNLGRPDELATTLGPMISKQAATAVRSQIKEAVACGATMLIDEFKYALSQPGTPYLAPQLLVNVNHSMSIMNEESFGPVAGIMFVDNDDEAVYLMNDSDYGLTAAIYTQDINVAKSLGERLETGTVFMNRCDYLDPALAWTGVKDSGRGCTLSLLGYDQLTQPKSYNLQLAEA
ncbi:aldehyde dehydrogenase family protein [Zooshikella harenae]|uniref:Aldehyde dehydrogenase family protein n=1 Tax=Zooshikella harenae TaxID=2827238 RepID=A0ABS5Z8C9_9GAMM|nr:aldehyde dehydrogenase family protein [Zooshikella harenae]MBU2709545.1 aldehyde dehydrogenase family protein [Zooshikella harenae]